MDSQMPKKVLLQEMSEAPNPIPKVQNSKLTLFGVIVVIIIAGLIGTGYFLGVRKSAEVATLHSNTSPTPDPTAHWATYMDPDNRFTFKYPTGWQAVVVSHSNNVVITTPDIAQDLQAKLDSSGACHPYYPIYIYDITNLPTNMQIPPPASKFAKKSLSIDGIPTRLFTITNTDDTKTCPFIGDKSSFVVVNKDNHIFRIDLSDATNADYIATFNELLTTFHMLGVSPTGISTPMPIPQSTYKDSYLGYSITYPKSWAFRQTYGPDIQKLAPTDIVSGLDLTYNTYVGTTPYTQATIVVNVLDAHGLTDTQSWIDAYDQNYPKNATKTSTTFQNVPAIIYTNTSVSLGAAEYIYFLSGNYAYRISIAQKTSITDDTLSIVNTFQP